MAATLTITLTKRSDDLPAQHRFSWLVEHEGVERGWGYCPERDTALAEAQEVVSDLLDPDEPVTVEIIER